MFGNRAIWADGWKAVTLHGKRMPWIVNSTTFPFEDDVWELYHVAEDFSESTDLADKHPEKLEELKKLWDKEAVKNNVYPLYDDMIKRMAKINDILFGDRKNSFTSRRVPFGSRRKRRFRSRTDPIGSRPRST